ncbi:phosphoglycolate phosphatase [Bordetella pertussis]|uniref:phosphoglycolate phosphatase n=5 Tax=Bordetella pertussis TaxID=520 RepID=Q7VZG8_BORPE|nr:HAD-IA family hydrolase [Bordetella pertussis]ETH37684.1 phosphoglycolate phosphatase [Bordetella pertussis H918]ETH42145.1 phosphoglycolate phosphatase [Bordetella pertussis H939]ETH47277.1 phosphoglycolate phosphatase [Bordetella pertussis H921]ETH71741.1 phosphoglycolate phosphatase [Bordetella pertussis STO1-CHLA-0011]ETH84873.1 phosphoglycolate phosphatase [Bordetella pertussis STO1-CHOC-0017]ETH87890.1 phosphoglycolate phosphatase [Bordetella pertussis STO1-CHOC-0018]ETH92686.1 phos
MSALILFDFDGTLADTAPDLAAAANRQRTRKGLEPMPYEALQPMASQGARGLLRAALGLLPDHPDYEPTRLQFLEDYAAESTVHSRLFPGIADLLEDIAQRGLSWGIVTNKVTYLTLPIVEHLGLTRDSAVLVCGDTTAHAKPHPLPLLHAAEQAGFEAGRCVYVGDDLRDIQAAHAAGMPAVAAAYGYVGMEEDVTTWQAEACAASPRELWSAIEPLLPTRATA